MQAIIWQAEGSSVLCPRVTGCQTGSSTNGITHLARFGSTQRVLGLLLLSKASAGSEIVQPLGLAGSIDFHLGRCGWRFHGP